MISALNVIPDPETDEIEMDWEFIKLRFGLSYEQKKNTDPGG
jgi:hypothetical protein